MHTHHTIVMAAAAEGGAGHTRLQRTRPTLHVDTSSDGADEGSPSQSGRLLNADEEDGNAAVMGGYARTSSVAMEVERESARRKRRHKRMCITSVVLLVIAGAAGLVVGLELSTEPPGYEHVGDHARPGTWQWSMYAPAGGPPYTVIHITEWHDTASGGTTPLAAYHMESWHNSSLQWTVHGTMSGGTWHGVCVEVGGACRCWRPHETDAPPLVDWSAYPGLRWGARGEWRLVAPPRYVSTAHEFPSTIPPGNCHNPVARTQSIINETWEGVDTTQAWARALDTWVTERLSLTAEFAQGSMERLHQAWAARRFGDARCTNRTHTVRSATTPTCSRIASQYAAIVRNASRTCGDCHANATGGCECWAAALAEATGMECTPCVDVDPNGVEIQLRYPGSVQRVCTRHLSQRCVNVVVPVTARIHFREDRLSASLAEWMLIRGMHGVP